MAANNGGRSLAPTRRLDTEASELLTDPIENVAFVREPWSGAPSDRALERWAFHVRDQYTLVFEFPSDYPFSGPYILIRILGDALTPVKRYLHAVTSLKADPLKPRFGYEDAHARIVGEEGMGLLSLRHWTPAITARILALQLIDDPVLQPALAEAPDFFYHE